MNHVPLTTAAETILKSWVTSHLKAIQFVSCASNEYELD